MHAISFIQDLAVIMLVAGVVTILFHRLNQPVVLGYIVAGFNIGPHTPPFGLIHDEDTIKSCCEFSCQGRLARTLAADQRDHLHRRSRCLRDAQP